MSEQLPRPSTEYKKWSLNKTCLICAQKQPSNNFYNQSMFDGVDIELRPYVADWLENYLKAKVEALRGLLLMKRGKPKKELARDIEILDNIIKNIEHRAISHILYELELLPYLNAKELQSDEQSRCPTFSISVVEIDQLGHILLNDYNHIKSHDDTYDYVHKNDNKKALEILYGILEFIREKALDSRDDVCGNCLELYHSGVHPIGECYVCCVWDWYNKKGMCEGMKVVSTPEDFPGWTDFQFSYEIPRIRSGKKRLIK